MNVFWHFASQPLLKVSLSAHDIAYTACFTDWNRRSMRILSVVQLITLRCVALRCVFHNKPLEKAIADTYTERAQLYFHSSDLVLQNYPLSQPWSTKCHGRQFLKKPWKWHWEHFKRRKNDLQYFSGVWLRTGETIASESPNYFTRSES